ncbi:MAG: hypothetical protein ACTSX9_02405 [Candidatus Njordarchaeales archaeon]
MNYKRYLIIYSDSQLIRTSTRRDLGEEQKYVISASLNPYNPLYSETKACIVDFDLLAFHASKVIFFTYIKDKSLVAGKYVLRRYPAPSEAINAEIRFVFNSPKAFAGKRISDPLELEIFLQWIPFLNLLKEMSNLTVALSAEGLSILSLNLLSLRDSLGEGFKSALGESRTLKNLIDIVKTYDDLVEILFRNITGLSQEETEILKEAPL